MAIAQMTAALPNRVASEGEVEELLLQEFLRRKDLRKKAESFLDFIKVIRPDFVFEETHIAIAEKLEAVARGEIDRVQIFVAPRTGKSLMGSVLFPAWYIGQFPDRQLLQIGHSTNISESFGRDTRNILMSDEYREMFRECALSKDSRSTGSWATTQNGKYNAAGAGTGLAGRGFHLACLDDVISEQDANSKTVLDGIAEWYSSGVYTRRMPDNNAIVIINTRWSTQDLSGQLLARNAVDPDADDWDVLSIPAELDEQAAEALTRISHDPKYRRYLATPQFPDPITFRKGDSFSPRRWPLKELLRAKGQMTRRAWAALYSQKPFVEGGQILKAEDWRLWTKPQLPECEYVIQVLDTAFEVEEANDFSARTTWGIFRRPEDGKYACILLERMKRRLSFPELRDEVYDSYLEYRPDRVLIEKKASGHSLLQELRRKGVPVAPLKAKDSKLARTHAASVVLEQGMVYYPDKQWAREVINECAEFPNGKNDDVHDTVVYAWLHLRKGFHMQLQDEPDDDDDEPKERRRHWYLNR